MSRRPDSHGGRGRPLAYRIPGSAPMALSQSPHATPHSPENGPATVTIPTTPMAFSRSPQGVSYDGDVAVLPMKKGPASRSRRGGPGVPGATKGGSGNQEGGDNSSRRKPSWLAGGEGLAEMVKEGRSAAQQGVPPLVNVSVYSSF